MISLRLLSILSKVGLAKTQIESLKFVLKMNVGTNFVDFLFENNVKMLEK